MTIVTDTFKLTPAAYFRIAAGAMLPGLAGIGTLILLAALAAGFIFDLRFLLVALIILFIVAPMIVGHIYFSKLLTAEAQYALMPKRVVITPDESISEVFESADPENTPPQTRIIKWEDIATRRISGKYLVIRFKNSNYILTIPIDAFGKDVAIEELADADYNSDDSDE